MSHNLIPLAADKPTTFWPCFLNYVSNHNKKHFIWYTTSNTSSKPLKLVTTSRLLGSENGDRGILWTKHGQIPLHKSRIWHNHQSSLASWRWQLSCYQTRVGWHFCLSVRFIPWVNFFVHFSSDVIKINLLSLISNLLTLYDKNSRMMV